MRPLNPPVLIVGAGVAGVTASISLTHLGIAHKIVDRHGVTGGAYNRMYPRTLLSSPPQFLRLDGSMPPSTNSIVQAADYSAYINSCAQAARVIPVAGCVTAVRREADGFVVTFEGAQETERYRAVIVCTGMFDNPFVPGIARSLEQHGFEVFHACKWRGPAALRGSRVLIVGAGMTAVELAEECVLSGLHPIMSARDRSVLLWPHQILGFDQRYVVYRLGNLVPVWMTAKQCRNGWMHRGINRGFSQFCRRGLIDIRPSVTSVQAGQIRFGDGTSAAVDCIVFATGYRFEMSFLPDTIERLPTGVPPVRACESVAWPGLFMLGVPCARRVDSHFVHGIVADAPHLAKLVRQHLEPKTSSD